MFEAELAVVGDRILAALRELGVPAPARIDWAPVPFSGQWGFGTAACFQAAALEGRAGRKGSVPERAQELATHIASRLAAPAGFSGITADKAYLNAYFDTAVFAGRVVDAALTGGPDLGAGRSVTNWSWSNTRNPIPTILSISGTRATPCWARPWHAWSSSPASERSGPLTRGTWAWA